MTLAKSDPKAQPVLSLPDHRQLPESDGTFVKNFQEHPQSILLTSSITPTLDRLHPDGNYAIGQDCGIYWRLTDPLEKGAEAPDWFYVAGVPPMLDGKRRRSYVMWKEFIVPLIAIEFVSGDGSEERDRTSPLQPIESNGSSGNGAAKQVASGNGSSGNGSSEDNLAEDSLAEDSLAEDSSLKNDSSKDKAKAGKFWVYEQAIRIPFYAIYEVDKASVEVYELIAQTYHKCKPNQRGHYEIAPLGVELGIWRGQYMNQPFPWLRWWDMDGNLLLTGEERAEQQQQRAEQQQQRAEQQQQRADQQQQRADQQQQRADQLAAKLREMGIDPDEI